MSDVAGDNEMRKEICAQEGNGDDNGKVAKNGKGEMDGEERGNKKDGEMEGKERKRANRRLLKRQPWRGRGQLLFCPRSCIRGR